jgi:dihydroorotate dehydrogenase
MRSALLADRGCDHSLSRRQPAVLRRQLSTTQHPPTASIPIIASLNGTTPEGWLDYARQMEQAGAAALELNVYHIPADLETSDRAVEELYRQVLREVKAARVERDQPAAPTWPPG